MNIIKGRKIAHGIKWKTVGSPSKQKEGVSLLMNRLSRVFVICLILMLTVMTINPANSYACSCAKPVSVKEEFERAKAVFYGKVMEIKDQKDPDGYMVKKVLFEVKNTWKGVSKSQMIMVTGQGGGDCGFEFRKGEEYLVYANDSSLYGDMGYLFTGICNLTNQYSDAKNDLLILGEGTPPTKDVNLENEFHSIGSHTYIWVIGVALIGLVAILVWIRFKKSNLND